MEMRARNGMNVTRRDFRPWSGRHVESSLPSPSVLNLPTPVPDGLLSRVTIGIRWDRIDHPINLRSQEKHESANVEPCEKNDHCA
jgi:hypothetical protein